MSRTSRHEAQMLKMKARSRWDRRIERILKGNMRKFIACYITTNNSARLHCELLNCLNRDPLDWVSRVLMKKGDERKKETHRGFFGWWVQRHSRAYGRSNSYNQSEYSYIEDNQSSFYGFMMINRLYWGANVLHFSVHTLTELQTIWMHSCCRLIDGCAITWIRDGQWTFCMISKNLNALNFNSIFYALDNTQIWEVRNRVNFQSETEQLIREQWNYCVLMMEHGLALL